MKPLWEIGPMAARDIYQYMPKERNWAYKTVKTMIGRLVKKGVITYVQIGNSYLYRPLYTRTQMTQAVTWPFIRRVFDGALQPFLTHFVQHLSDDELEVLQHEVARIKKEKPNKRSKTSRRP